MPKSYLYLGDCIEVMKRWRDDSVPTIVTDPPYGLEFMGEEWDAPWKSDRRQTFDGSLTDNRDSPFGRARVRFGGGASYGADKRASHGYQLWATEWAAELFRIGKPGAYLLSFGGTRMYHRLACAIEDAGWEIRDSISWLYGSGFPKSLDVSKAIDKAAGAEREVVAVVDARMPQAQAQGWGNQGVDTFRERKGTVPMPTTVPSTDTASQWSGWGTALKPAWEPIIVARKPLIGTVAANVLKYGTGGINIDGCRVASDDTVKQGRWPANVILDEEAAATLDEQTGTMRARDTGGASRFFYTAKASRSERTNGGTVDNSHPTVKPLSLMRYLVRLVTPEGGRVLDPFTGSGSTGVACVEEGFDFVGIERSAEYLEIAKTRLEQFGEVRCG